MSGERMFWGQSNSKWRNELKFELLVKFVFLVFQVEWKWQEGFQFPNNVITKKIIIRCAAPCVFLRPRSNTGLHLQFNSWFWGRPERWPHTDVCRMEWSSIADGSQPCRLIRGTEGPVCCGGLFASSYQLRSFCIYALYVQFIGLDS